MPSRWRRRFQIFRNGRGLSPRSLRRRVTRLKLQSRETPESRSNLCGRGKTARLRLDPVHEEGKHKARVFASALGLSRNDAGWLRDQLLLAAKNSDCSLGRKTDHGQRYVMDFDVTIRGQTARLRSAWNVRPGENFPRLVTCYVL